MYHVSLTEQELILLRYAAAWQYSTAMNQAKECPKHSENYVRKARTAETFKAVHDKLKDIYMRGEVK